jgi:phage-related protein
MAQKSRQWLPTPTERYFAQCQAGPASKDQHYMENEPFLVHNAAMLPKLSAAFYAQKGLDPPSQPVRDWLKSLTKEERTEVGGDIHSVQFGWPIGMPLVKHLQGDLWEVRTQLASRIARVIFAVEGNTMYLLHGFINRTPK